MASPSIGAANSMVSWIITAGGHERTNASRSRSITGASVSPNIQPTS